jgi:hypothetical protein
MRARGAFLTPRRHPLPDDLASPLPGILSCYFEVPAVSCKLFIFKMFSAFVEQKSLFRPFVFNMFSAFAFSWVGGHKVAMRFVGSEAWKMES